MKFKREHKYSQLETYEEKLYKEVIYDMRPISSELEVHNSINPLKKVKARTHIRNVKDF